MTEPTYTTMIYKEYPVTITISCGLPTDETQVKALFQAIAKKIYGVSSLTNAYKGGICQFTVEPNTSVGGFIMREQNGAFESGYLFIIVQQQSGEEASVTTDLKAWKYLNNCIDGVDNIFDTTNKKAGINTHGNISLGVAAVSSSNPTQGNFYVPRKSFMLEGRHEDIIKGQAATHYSATNIWIGTLEENN